MTTTITKKKFQEMLNAADLERRANPEQGRWRHNRYHARTRPYGDYLRAQDLDMFNMIYREFLDGEHQSLNKYL